MISVNCYCCQPRCTNRFWQIYCKCWSRSHNPRGRKLVDLCPNTSVLVWMDVSVRQVFMSQASRTDKPVWYFLYKRAKQNKRTYAGEKTFVNWREQIPASEKTWSNPLVSNKNTARTKHWAWDSKQPIGYLQAGQKWINVFFFLSTLTFI